MHSIELLGPPIPAARPRVTRRGITFDPKAAQKKAAKRIAIEQWKLEPVKEPLSLELTFSMPIPKSTSKKKRAQLLGSPHVIKPDCDNLAKFALDVLSGIVYGDDSCVFDLKISKTYSNEPKTLIRVVKYAGTT